MPTAPDRSYPFHHVWTIYSYTIYPYYNSYKLSVNKNRRPQIFFIDRSATYEKMAIRAVLGSDGHFD